MTKEYWRKTASWQCVVTGMLAVILLAGSLFEATPALAAPERVALTFEGRSLSFEVPEELCALDQSEEADFLVFESMRRALAPDNTLLSYWIDCADHQKLRRGELQALGRYVLIFSPKTPSRQPFLTITRAEHVTRTAAFFDSPAFHAEMKKRVKQEFRDRDFNEIFVEDLLDADSPNVVANDKQELEVIRQQILEGKLNLFPLGQDETAAYLGYAIPNGAEVRAGVGAATLINTIPLVLISYDVPASKRLYAELHKQISKIAARAVAINDPQ